MAAAPHVTKVIPVGFADVSQFVNLVGDAEAMAITFGAEADLGGFNEAHVLAMREAYKDAFLDLMSPAYSVGTCRVTANVGGLDPAVLEAQAVSVGTDTAGLTLPSNCALLVRKATGLGGRRNRGRVFQPGVLNEQAVSELGIIGAPAFLQDAWIAYYAALQVTAATNIANLVIFHSYSWAGDVDPGPPAGFPAPTVITGFEVQSLIATQRRRLRR